MDGSLTGAVALITLKRGEFAVMQSKKHRYLQGQPFIYKINNKYPDVLVLF